MVVMVGDVLVIFNIFMVVYSLVIVIWIMLLVG